MNEQQKAAFHMGYLKAISDLLDQTKSTPILNREHLFRAMEKHIEQMKSAD